MDLRRGKRDLVEELIYRRAHRKITIIFLEHGHGKALPLFLAFGARLFIELVKSKKFRTEKRVPE